MRFEKGRLVFSQRKCAYCGKTQDDWDKVGRKWAKDNDAGGYGIPGFMKAAGKAVCDFCALEIMKTFAEVYPDMARAEVIEIWRRHNSKTVSRP